MGQPRRLPPQRDTKSKEAKVLAADVREILERTRRRFNEDEGIAVSVIAERAGVSTRTVYRVLENRPDAPAWLGLELADRLLVACDANLWEVQVRHTGP